MTTLINPFIYGGGVTLPATLNVLDAVISPASALAEIRFIEDGTIENQNSTVIGNWFTPTTAGVGNLYEIRWTNVSGVPDSSIPLDGTWGGISPSAAFNEGQVGIGASQAVGTVEIRPNAGAVVASSTVTLEAEVTL